jgi:hypothetical protein
MLKQTVYVETSVVSYLTARPSRNIIAYSRQIATQDWWDRRRDDFDLVTSPLVLEEASAGDAQAASKRLDILAGLDVLAVDSTIESAANDLIASNVLPTKAAADAMHIAIAAVHEVDYLLTWNCRHIANVELYSRIAAHLRERGLTAPIVCNPQELMGDDIYSS